MRCVVQYLLSMCLVAKLVENVDRMSSRVTKRMDTVAQSVALTHAHAFFRTDSRLLHLLARLLDVPVAAVVDEISTNGER